MNDPDRRQQRSAWLDGQLRARGERLLAPPIALTADASFRRFERVHTDRGDHILMDAPPEQENNSGFLTVAAWLQAHDLPAPRLLAADTLAGFMLVTDLGDTTLARAIAAQPSRGPALHDAAIDALLAFQSAGQSTGQSAGQSAAQSAGQNAAQDAAQNAVAPSQPPFPAYDRARLTLENELFGRWFLAGMLDLPAAPAVLAETLEELTEHHLAAARVPVHLDWHSRNLMVLPRSGAAPGTGSETDAGSAPRIAMVDFQDARMGPQGYDLVSLLRDCYRELAPRETERCVERFLHKARALDLPGCADRSEFLRVFDLVGVQRHLKAIGIFSRLSLRDDRHHALADIPRTLDHILRVAPAHAETRALGHWLDTEVRPRLHARSQRLRS